MVFDPEKKMRELQERIDIILLHEPITYAMFARAADISLPAFYKFIHSQNKTSMKTLKKIEKYVIVKERELHLKK